MVLDIPEKLFIFIFSWFVFLLHIYFNLVTVKTMVKLLISAAYWGALLIRRRHLLESGPYSDLNVNGAALIRGQCLLEEV